MKEYLKLLTDPREFFNGVSKEKISTTIKKVAIPLIILIIITSILSTYLFSGFVEPVMSPTINLIFSVLMSFVTIPISIIILSGLLQLSFKILKVKAIFSQTVKAMLYVSIPMYIATIPIILISLAFPSFALRLTIYIVLAIGIFIWFIVLLCKGLSELQKTTMGRAVGAYFLSMGLILAIYIIFVIIIVIFVGLFYVLTKLK